MRLPFIITTSEVLNPDFFIQSKGLNAGQPLKIKITNCFSVGVHPDLLNDQYFFYVVEYLFITDRFKPHIKGSVVPYLTIEDVEKVIIQFFKELK